MKRFDVLIVGAGAVGNAIARELSKNGERTVGVLEKEPDTAFGISGRNSGVLHAGFNNKPGSLMARLCVQGAEGFEREAAELDLAFKRTGKLVIARYEEDLPALERLLAQGEENGVQELRIIGKEELEKLAGYEAGVAALWSGTSGIFDPFLYTVALAEAAVEFGTEYFFGRQVTEIEASREIGTSGAADAGARGTRDFLVTAQNRATGEQEHFCAGVLINSAGLFADEIGRMAGAGDYTLHPCRGEYHILDKKCARDLAAAIAATAANRADKGPAASSPLSGALEFPIYPIPNEREGGLGVHLTPAIHGNILIGPSAEYLAKEQEPEDYSTTQAVMDRLREEGAGLFPGLDVRNCIRSFSGIRPKLVSEEEGGYADFVVEESRQVPGFIQLIGIESPGLTASIPIAQMVKRMVEEIEGRGGEDRGTGADDAKRREAAVHKAAVHRAAVHGAKAQSSGDRRVHFGEPGDQKMICRCEGITEEAVLNAFDRILQIGAIPTVKGLKNRTRITMGNCQGSFCTVNLVDLLQKKRNVEPRELLWNGFGSRMFEGKVKG